MKKYAVICIMSVVLLLAACATKAKFLTSTVVPAAEGDVRVKKDDNNNYSIKVLVENLAEPNRLPQPKSMYVVWAEMPGGTKNLGRLNVD